MWERKDWYGVLIPQVPRGGVTEKVNVDPA
jgi:hypothetical protein